MPAHLTAGEGAIVTDRARRKELTAEYRRTRPEAGVYLIRCSANGKALLGSTLDLRSFL